MCEENEDKDGRREVTGRVVRGRRVKKVVGEVNES